MESTPIPSLGQVPDPQSINLLIYTVVDAKSTAPRMLGGVPFQSCGGFTLMASLTASAITRGQPPDLPVLEFLDGIH